MPRVWREKCGFENLFGSQRSGIGMLILIGNFLLCAAKATASKIPWSAKIDR